MPVGELLGDTRHTDIENAEGIDFRAEYAKQYQQVESLVKRNKELEAQLQLLTAELNEKVTNDGEIDLVEALKAKGVSEVYLKF
jgi:cell division protein FtsB